MGLNFLIAVVILIKYYEFSDHLEIQPEQSPRGMKANNSNLERYGSKSQVVKKEKYFQLSTPPKKNSVDAISIKNIMCENIVVKRRSIVYFSLVKEVNFTKEG